ncbi:MAG: cation diffusion facilitator family transporter [Actinomycetota bacterium]
MSQAKRLKIAVALNVVIIAMQISFGIRAHSLGLLADAGHNFTDVGALFISLWAVQLVRRSPTTKRSFGYHRSGILAAQANAALILIASSFIVFESVRRFAHPHHVEGFVVVVAAAVALLANGAAAMLLNDHSGDVNMRSAVLHMVGDAAASAGVVVAGLVMYVTDGSEWLDPLVSILIGIVIAWRAIQLLMHTTDILMEATPASLDVQAMTDAVMAVDGVESLHDLHVWSLSSAMRALSTHIVLDGHPTLEEAQRVGERIKAVLAHDFAIGHATLELECEPCSTHLDGCLIAETHSHHAHGHGHAH